MGPQELPYGMGRAPNFNVPPQAPPIDVSEGPSGFDQQGAGGA